MSIFHKARPGSRGGKDQFNWDTVKSDKDRECYLGHSLMAPTGRWQEGKDLTWYAKDRESDQQQIKSAEFRAAKKLEEDALMAALGMKVMPPPAVPPPPTPRQPVIKREPQSTFVKNEPMTPAIHGGNRHTPRDEPKKKQDKQRRDDRRRRRQLKATGSDEEKHEWSETDEEDISEPDEDAVNDVKDQTLQLDPQNTMTDKDLETFLVDLVKKHGLKTIQRSLKSDKEGKERKRKRDSGSSSSASESEEPKRESKHKRKHKKKPSHKTEASSSKRSPSPSSSRKDRSKHHRKR